MQIYAEQDKRVLTDEQREAVLTIDRSVSLLAGAGSGKTYVLIERCVEILRQKATSLENLLVVTFTEKAAQELKFRLKARLPHLEAEIQNASISTIHAFCASILRENAPTIGIDPSFTILDQSSSELLIHRTAKSVILNLLNQRDSGIASLIESFGFKKVMACIEELLSFRWHADNIRKKPPPAEQGDEENRLISAIFKCLEICEYDLNVYKGESNMLDFQDLEILTLKLLSENKEIKEYYQKRFKHILIDEFQDTNDIQMEIVDLLWSPKKNILYIVGDPSQSIYRFRGANVSCFLKLSREIERKGGKIINLSKNFRSRPKIIDAINKICQNIFKDGNTIPYSPLTPHRKEKDEAAFTILKADLPESSKAFEIRTREALSIAKIIKDLKEDGHSFSDIACLFQSLKGIEPYETVFRAQGIPYRVLSGSGFLDRQEVIDIINILKLTAMMSKNDINDIVLYAVLRSPLGGLTDDECYKLRFGSNSKSFLDSAMYSPTGRLLTYIKEISPHKGVSDLLRSIIEYTSYDYILSAVDPSGQAEANIEKIISMAEAMEEQEYCTLEDFVDYIEDLKARKVRVGDSPSTRQGEDQVLCMTVHAAKGLEFPVVILADTIHEANSKAGRWCFVRGLGLAVQPPDEKDPLNKGFRTPYFERIFEHEKGEDREERKRLLYVAMTRAMERLIIPIYPNIKKGQWNKWLSEIDLDDYSAKIFGKEDVAPVSAGETAKISKLPDTRSPILLRHRPALSVTEIETFCRCPLEYFLKFIYRIPSAPFEYKGPRDLPPNILGDIVHSIIERLKLNPETDYRRILSGELRHHNILDEDGRHKSDIKKIVDVYKKWAGEKKYSRAYTEWPFIFRLAGHVVKGKIDLIGRTNDGWEIIDYKTDSSRGKREMKKEEERYSLQMMVYALAASYALDEPINRTVLCFLNEPRGEAVTHEVITPPAAKIENELTDILKNIDLGEISILSDNRPCYECYYGKNNICEKKRI